MGAPDAAERAGFGGVVRFRAVAVQSAVFGTVPALRCTAEEALHRVRDTRFLALPRLITPQPRQLIGMEIGITKQLLAYPRAFHEEADIELVGHAHAAMHLHTF